ncbi:hypothetical protein BJI67_00050 [Acidihalobacter aeolianus]|uniref:NAD-dependent epimerase/dehydratase domain-containing protein n=1 Tax=Acidihalobacter aeolianus TaxID=2792603 RepID=A0A1D8K417_9GAMM|nr:hypothetical protein BJI67_00050 [Acidihalobacter aeolianus]
MWHCSRGYHHVLNTLILGGGYLGKRVARRLSLTDTDSIALTARPNGTLPALLAESLPAFALDLDALDPPQLVPPWRDYGLLYLVPPPRDGNTDARLSRALAMLEHQPPRHIVYAGTSGVYGDCGGRWIDETAPLRPDSDRALRRVDAEAQLSIWCKSHDCSLILLRIGGIYGPDRLPLQRLRHGRPIVDLAEAPWSNRIHVDDLVSVCIEALRRPGEDHVFNVADGNPSSTSRFLLELAQAYQLSSPLFVSLREAIQRASPEGRIYLSESRRLCNRLLLSSLHLHLQYPTLADALARDPQIMPPFLHTPP